MTIIAPKPATSRDHRIDFWRGIALCMIFVNHVPGNVWERFTSRNFGFSDAAELFVFLAGFAAAFAYGRNFNAGYRLLAIGKAWRRAGTLILVQAMLTMFAIGLFCWAALAFGDGEFLMRINLANFVTRPIDTMLGFAMLGNQMGYVNILPMYAVLLLILPVHLWLGAKDPRLMMAAAVVMWIATWTFDINLPNYPNLGGWFFNPFAWQVILAAGLFAGYRKAAGLPSLPYHPWLFGAALAYLLVSFVTVQYGLWFLIYGLEPLPGLISSNDKTFVTLPRLLHVLALAYVFANASAASPFSRISTGNPFALLGRHSLPVFAFGTMLSLVFQIVKWNRPQDFVFDTLLLSFGIGLQFALASWLEWWTAYQKQVKRPAPANAEAPSGASSSESGGVIPVPAMASSALAASRLTVSEPVAVARQARS